MAQKSLDTTGKLYTEGTVYRRNIQNGTEVTRHYRQTVYRRNCIQTEHTEWHRSHSTLKANCIQKRVR